MKRFLFGFLFFTFFSCQETSPKLLISEDQLIEILVDTHIAEAAIQSLIKIDKDSFGALYYKQIFEIHQVSQTDFEATMTEMRTDPIQLEKIYAQVMEKLSAVHAEHN